MNDTKFKAQIYPLRVFSGPSSLSNLPKEVTRLGVGRVLVISGRTVSRATALVNDIESLLGERFAARFDEVDRHCLEPCMTRALEMAQALQVDAIVSVGAGTACMAARILAIALAEEEPFERLSTHYEPGKVPVSPRLYKPKVPIWNVLTTATSAQNGAGATMKTYPQAERWEFFDPKTRAMGVFWDANALASTSDRRRCVRLQLHAPLPHGSRQSRWQTKGRYARGGGPALRPSSARPWSGCGKIGACVRASAPQGARP
jgi:alcohol dehydrogenase class IV